MTALADPAVALGWVRVLNGLAIALSSVEALTLRRELRPGGLYFDPRSRPSVFLALMAARLLAALAVAAGALGPHATSLALFGLVALSLVAHRRLRHGLSGADPMMGIVAAALALASLRPHDGGVQAAVVWFVALQGVISYTSAGITKLGIPEWRQGTYLREVLSSRTVGHPRAARVLSLPGVSVAATWAVFAWELSFPLSLVTGPRGAVLFCVAGLLFHVVVAVVSGLKMFVLAFAAIYPAIVSCALQVAAWRAR